MIKPRMQKFPFLQKPPFLWDNLTDLLELLWSRQNDSEDQQRLQGPLFAQR